MMTLCPFLTAARRAAAVAPFLLAAIAPAVHAQADGPVLRGKAVTESNVLDALTPAPGNAAAPAPADGDVDVSVRTRSLKVEADGPPSSKVLAPKKKPSASLLITFETNSAALTARSKEQLDVVAAALKNDKLRNFTFNVEGHADARGSSDANRQLSQERAEAVRMYLVSAQNVPAERLKAVGKGDSEPMNTRDVAAAENRRVTIVTNTQ